MDIDFGRSFEIELESGDVIQYYPALNQFRVYQESHCGEGQLRSATAKSPDLNAKLSEMMEDVQEHREIMENPEDAEDDEGELDDEQNP